MSVSYRDQLIGVRVRGVAPFEVVAWSPVTFHPETQSLPTPADYDLELAAKEVSYELNSLREKVAADYGLDEEEIAQRGGIVGGLELRGLGHVSEGSRWR